ncbi:hypothetical protein L1049_019757 [Liquidambar formosana]|uniref:Uncharacterized protein n=1 Tax=Liquidambar formosana TaxID=63359 RepID=A0AAP0S739_LIQFO
MDQREYQLQSLGICHRLFNFIMKILEAQALKPVTLGPPMHHGLTQLPILDASQNRLGFMCDESMHLMAQETSCEGHDSGDEALEDLAHVNTLRSPSIEEKNDSSADQGKAPQEVEAAPSIVPQARAPKKSVSINDRAEEIIDTSKKNKRKKAAEKSASMEREKDEPKPLKSILKVGSNVNEKSDSFTDRTREATNKEG